MSRRDSDGMRIYVGLLAGLLFLLAFAGFASAENMTVTYFDASGAEIVHNFSDDRPEVNITLPNTSWDMEIRNEESRFSIMFEGINVSYAQPVDVLARDIDEGIQSYNGSMGNTYDYDYYVLYAYAFNISQIPALNYTVRMNYSGSFAGHTSVLPQVIKCEHDFVTGLTNTSDCVGLPVLSRSGGMISVNSSGFSSFFLVEDHCNNGVQDYGESGADCGGSCVACPSGGSTGGGGGGGGGGASSGPKVIYVTPTPEGETVKVYAGDELIIIYNDGEYHYMITKVGDWMVRMRSLATYYEHEFHLGEFKQIGLTSFLAKEVEVSMYVSNHFATLTFKTVDRPRFSIPLLAPKPYSGSRQTADQGVVQPGSNVYTPRTQPPAAAAPATQSPATPSAVEVPDSPINIWTIVVALVFVIFLVGGIALYRTKLHDLGKPPTVTRTGMEPVGLPENSRSAPLPAHPVQGVSRVGADLDVVAAGAVSGALAEKRSGDSEKRPGLFDQEGISLGDEPDVVHETRREGSKGAVKESRLEISSSPEKKHVVEYHVPRAKKLELEKYVFHAYSMGFGQVQVKKALIEKGWPEELVDQILSEIKHEDYE